MPASSCGTTMWHSFAYIYFEGRAEPPLSAKLLTRNEASRIAANVVKLPEFCNE